MGRAFPGGATCAISSVTSEIVSSSSQWADRICSRMWAVTRFSPFDMGGLLSGIVSNYCTVGVGMEYDMPLFRPPPEGEVADEALAGAPRGVLRPEWARGL